jgi:hypothetical protein
LNDFEGKEVENHVWIVPRLPYLGDISVPKPMPSMVKHCTLMAFKRMNQAALCRSERERG